MGAVAAGSVRAVNRATAAYGDSLVPHKTGVVTVVAVEHQTVSVVGWVRKPGKMAYRGTRAVKRWYLVLACRLGHKTWYAKVACISPVAQAAKRSLP